MKICLVRVFVVVSLFFLAVRDGRASQVHPRQEYVEGDVIVTFKPGAASATVAKTLSGHSLGWKRHFGRLSRHRGREMGLLHAKNRTTAQLIAELSSDPTVETVEPNYLRWISSKTPNDALFTNLWALQNIGQPVAGATGASGDDIHFVSAWALARTDSTNPAVVAVLDTGVDYTHPDLAGNMWTNSGEIPGNGMDDDADGYVDDYYGYDFADNLSDPTDSGQHGTHVAGTIAAVGNNELGVIGVDYQAKIMALRASSDGSYFTDAAIIDAINYAIMKKNSGVNIVAINESLGGGGSNSVEYAAMQAAGDAGIIFCVAAGNSAGNNDTSPTYPAGYHLPNMIVVAASDQNDALAYFSNYGASTVDLAAPGINVLSTMPITSSYVPEGTAFSLVQQGGINYSANEMEYSTTTTGITATVYYCGLGNSSDFPPAVKNNIALIQRGTLTFSNKVLNAMAAGARAAIIYNNVSGNFSGTLMGTSVDWIPTVSLSQSDGLALQTNTSVTVIHGLYQYLDGTSMATPHVSGAVAFAAMNFPDETVTQRVQRVLGNVDVIPALVGMVRTGGRLNLERIVDTDTNNLPDWWETEYFGHLTGTGANADTDHDGLSNLSEWLAGTNPTNTTSGLWLTLQSAGSSSSGAVLGWPSVAGKTYRLERATNLMTGFNSVIGTNITATAPFNTITDSVAVPGGTRFYRVGVEE